MDYNEYRNGMNYTLKAVLVARPIDVRRAVLEFKPTIVHFCGHGEGNGGLAFENATGQTQLVSAEALSGFFRLFSSTVECVVLNACYSALQAEAIAQHINYVVGMQRSIEDRAAIEFAVAFYDALGVGETTEFAYELGCNAIQWFNLPEHMTPTLKRKPYIKKESDHPKESFSQKIDITGQWLDPSDNDTVYFKQNGSRVVGFYDFGQRRKTGVYLGYLKGRTLDYEWRWLDQKLNGCGRMTLSDNGSHLSGSWWYGKKEIDVEHVGYQYLSSKMPEWLSKADFKEIENSF